MRANNISEAAKILIYVGTVLIVCVLCAVGFKMTNEGKSAVNASASNLNGMTSQYSDIDKSIYDGATVQGSQVVNVIKNTINAGEYLAVRVSTKAATNRDYNYVFVPGASGAASSLGTKVSGAADTQLTESKAASHYINENASFDGKVYKDANNIIICIEFTQN
ncbi:MAG: hypothetical protein K0R00_3831 [Herbinix sp.]|jgi:hypothetical protein|nr:hypothetical protein [Herbinix sp.]